MGAMQESFAQEAVEAEPLETIKVTAVAEPEKKISETVKTSTDLSREMVNDSRDLVRYETGVSVVETGRMGSSGYAIRGVDENRVAIMVDGLHQAETLSSQGFKELFEGYGNFNNTRNNVEIEHLKQATILKGADSVRAGSGALGGAVIFETKDARDYLTEKDYHLGYKTGYATANNQWLHSATLAGKYKWFDALVVGTKRDGHNFENYGYKDYDSLAYGRNRQKADPYEIQRDSVLAKLSFTPTENHRFTVMADHSKQEGKGHDFSYTLSRYSDSDALRHTHDVSKRSVFGLSYENTTANVLWDKAKISISSQKIKNSARTEDYCDGNPKCNQIANPLGLQYKNGKIVDANGQEPTLRNNDNGDRILSVAGKEILDISTYDINSSLRNVWFDCSVVDCNGQMSGYSIPSGKYPWDRDFTWHHQSYDFKPTRIKDEQGREFAQVDAGYGVYYLKPNGAGYIDNYIDQRDLNTDSKQFDAELSKIFTTGQLEHHLKYGFMYNQTEKEMINYKGNHARDVQWWANRFVGTDWRGNLESCATTTSSSIKWNPVICPRDEVFSFLIPVESKTGSLMLSNNIRFNDKLSLDLGYRYERVKYKSNYVAGETAKIPDDMVKGVFIPLPDEPVNPGFAPSPWSSKYDYDRNHPQYIADLAEYQKKKAQYDIEKKAYDDAVASNPAENIAYFGQPKTFSNSSYALGFTFDPLDYLRIQAKYSSAFRAPTTDELYFTFKHPSFSVKPNVDLKSERANNKELALTLHGDMGSFTTSVFRTDYKDFIDLSYLGRLVEAGRSSQTYYVYQNINRDKAHAKGIELNARWNVGANVAALDGLNVNLKLTAQKGKISTEHGQIPMNAIQPRTTVLNIGYDHPSEKFGANFYATHVTKKKVKDTYNMFYDVDSAISDENLYHTRWQSGNYTLLDFTTYYRPMKNLTLSAGVYNLANRKYMTWDSARSIREFGTTNMVNERTGQGLERFYAPERNYKIGLEFTF